MIIIFLLGFLTVINAKVVTVKAQGIFACNNENSKEPLHIELMEHDEIGEDDLLAWANVVGHPYYWDIQGKEDEIISIRPYLVIKHMCKGVRLFYVKFQRILLQIKERAVIEIERIGRDVSIDFGYQDLEDPHFSENMKQMIKEQVKKRI
ncbi:unnamed protein product [Haemonchus placei]|uniref:Transthyretin-like protein 46 n=1 Tax=Haemonchus placei TaxID=6290 RepID=A0A0N4W7P7_HAEPC|nr:unnamed protein product [Haemonchus placei]